jgi:hypothetical protein
VNQQSWDVATDVDGYGHTLLNNLSYAGAKGDYISINQSLCTLSNNTFLPAAMSVAVSDFQSVDGSQLKTARNSDGTLPDITFLKLNASSSLYGKKIGYQFDYDADATGILSVASSSSLPKTSDLYYSLSGIPTCNPSKGIFIHNGKKLMK